MNYPKHLIKERIANTYRKHKNAPYDWMEIAAVRIHDDVKNSSVPIMPEPGKEEKYIKEQIKYYKNEIKGRKKKLKLLKKWKRIGYM